MSSEDRPIPLHLALPKGRMESGVLSLLCAAGVDVQIQGRGYRPRVSLPAIETKLLKPRNVVQMLEVGSRDLGFAGADWVAEHGAELVELLDTGLDPVKLVAAAPSSLLEDGLLPSRPLVVASEYRRLTEDWVRRRRLDARYLRTYGATEVFPPEDADVIVDNTATGATLEANDLVVVDELMGSSTRLYAHPGALDCPDKRARIEGVVLLLRSVLDARRRVMLELNVNAAQLDAVIEVLPCMDQPTVAALHGGGGFGVKAAVPRADLARVVPLVKARGGSDIVVSEVSQIVP